jgi:integrase
VFLFEHVAEKYLALKQNRRAKTVVSAELHVRKHLMPFFRGFAMSSIADNWESYVAFKRLESPTRKFFNDAKHMKGVLKLALELGCISRQMTVKSPDGQVNLGKEYTEPEISRLLSHANPNLQLQIKMAYIMGMRRSEILLLKWDRIDLAVGLIRLRGEDTKTNTPREVPIHKEVWIELERRRTADPSATFLFASPTIRDQSSQNNKTAWRDCKTKACVDGRFHDLRHTAVTRMLYVFNIPPAKVGAIVGMSMAVINRYAHPKGKYLQDAMDSIRGVSGTDEKDGGLTSGNIEAIIH